MVAKFVLTECAREEAPLVRLAVEIDDVRAFELGFGEDHSSPPLALDDGQLAIGPALHVSAMSEVVSEDAVGDQLLDVADALVARPLELLERELRLAIGVVDLLGAA